jgi:hypothetical protein
LNLHRHRVVSVVHDFNNGRNKHFREESGTMGATGWFHEVPWQSEVQTALDELCARIFANGSYRQMWDEYPEMLDGWAELDGMEPVPGFAASLEAIEAGGQPTTIPAAELLNQGEGFGDVLDCRVVSASYEFGCVAPLTTETVMQLFGSESPTAVQIRESSEALLELPILERGCGLYAVGFIGATPESIFFFGFSGD